MASIKKIGTDLNWDVTKKAIYGVYKGYTVTLIQNISYSNSQNNFKLLCIPIANATSGNTQVLNGFIQANKKALKVFSFDVKQDLVSIRLIEMFKGINAESFISILDLLLQGFTEAKIEPKSTCIYCNEEGVETHSYINDIKFPSHESCKQDAINKNEALKDAIANQPSSPAGFIGAVIGAIIGAVPYAVAVWFGWYVGILAFLTGIASYWGFKQFGGKVKKSTKYLIAVISMVVILLSNVALMGVIAIQYDVTLAQVLSVNEIQEIFFQSLGMSALFGALGVAAVVSRIRKDEFSSDIK